MYVSVWNKIKIDIFGIFAIESLEISHNSYLQLALNCIAKLKQIWKYNFTYEDIKSVQKKRLQMKMNY